MSQMSLPLYNPRDKGRLNALRSILAAVSDELRQQAPVAQGIVDFSVNQFPQILRQNTPFELLSIAEPYSPEPISPYSFEVLDFVDLPSNLRRPDVFSSVAELIKVINVNELAEPLQQAELIGIDESQVDTPLPQSALAYLKSIAFRMYQLPNGATDEAAGPILNEMRMQLREDESFENENKLLSYIRNNFIAFVSALTSIQYGRKPFVVIHGPLVRAIGGFSNLTFDYDTAKDLFSLDVSEAGEFGLSASAHQPALQGDEFTQENMSFIPLEAINGERNLYRFTEFCLNRCGRKCASSQVPIPSEAAPEQGRITTAKLKGRLYPGFCLYFWMLRSLYDLTRLSDTTVSSVVENVSAATEMTRLILPSLLSISAARQRVENSSLRAALRAVRINRLSQQPNSRELYRNSRQIIDSLRFSDSNIFSYVLAEGQYTAPVQVYRYRTRNTFERVLGYIWLGIRDELAGVLDDTLFPSQPFQGRSGKIHPGYRVMMSYVRTTPLREPIRLEYFDLENTPITKVAGPIYLLSLPYQEYGIPIILYYADKLARTPTQLVRAIIEREYLELVLQNRFSDPVSIMRILGRLSRGYFQREGLQ